MSPGIQLPNNARAENARLGEHPLEPTFKGVLPDSLSPPPVYSDGQTPSLLVTLQFCCPLWSSRGGGGVNGPTSAADLGPASLTRALLLKERLRLRGEAGVLFL